jgi:hypothetical protein
MTMRRTASREVVTVARASLSALMVCGFLATAATAGTALEAQYGSPAALLLPEINGMGGTGAALYRGGVSNVINPAFLSAEQGWRLDAAVAVEEAHEDRFVPLFDTFVSYVTDTATATTSSARVSVSRITSAAPICR